MAIKTRPYFTTPNAGHTRFVTLDKPTQGEFANLFDSVTFKLEQTDKAQQPDNNPTNPQIEAALQGLVKLIDNSDAIARITPANESPVGKWSWAVKPTQLPEYDTIDNGFEWAALSLTNPLDRSTSTQDPFNVHDFRHLWLDVTAFEAAVVSFGQTRVSHTVFVDATNGNDSTGLSERLDKPFQSINAAITAMITAAGGGANQKYWQVYVLPGKYDSVGAATPGLFSVIDTGSRGDLNVFLSDGVVIEAPSGKGSVGSYPTLTTGNISISGSGEIVSSVNSSHAIIIVTNNFNGFTHTITLKRLNHTVNTFSSRSISFENLNVVGNGDSCNVIINNITINDPSFSTGGAISADGYTRVSVTTNNIDVFRTGRLFSSNSASSLSSITVNGTITIYDYSMVIQSSGSGTTIVNGNIVSYTVGSVFFNTDISTFRVNGNFTHFGYAFFQNAGVNFTINGDFFGVNSNGIILISKTDNTSCSYIQTGNLITTGLNPQLISCSGTTPNVTFLLNGDIQTLFCNTGLVLIRAQANSFISYTHNGNGFFGIVGGLIHNQNVTTSLFVRVNGDYTFQSSVNPLIRAKNVDNIKFDGDLITGGGGLIEATDNAEVHLYTEESKGNTADEYSLINALGNSTIFFRGRLVNMGLGDALNNMAGIGSRFVSTGSTVFVMNVAATHSINTMALPARIYLQGTCFVNKLFPVGLYPVLNPVLNTVLV